MASGSGPIPALVEPAAVAGDEVRWCLVRGVTGARGEPQEERFGRGSGAEVAQEQDRLVGQVLGEVVALLGRSRGSDGVVVVHQVGPVLVGLPSHEAVVPLEAPTERPLVAGAPHRHLGGRCQVPLPHGVGGVPVANQDLGQEAVLFGDGGVVARETRSQLHHARHPVRVVVAAGEQARTRRRAQHRGVEVGVPATAPRHPIEARRLDVGAVTAELGVADVVEQHHDDVRGTVGRGRQRRPPCFGVVISSPDLALERLAHSTSR